MDIPACVFYIATVCMCVKKRGKNNKKKEKTTGRMEKTRGIRMTGKVPVLLSQYESSLILVSRNHAKLNNHHTEVCPCNGFP